MTRELELLRRLHEALDPPSRKSRLHGQHFNGAGRSGDLASATAAVAEQTYEMRRNNRAYGIYDLLDVMKAVPLTVKRAVPRLIHLTGDRFVDTAMLSNLGRLPAPPAFGPKQPLNYGFAAV